MRLSMQWAGCGSRANTIRRVAGRRCARERVVWIEVRLPAAQCEDIVQIVVRDAERPGFIYSGFIFSGFVFSGFIAAAMAEMYDRSYLRGTDPRAPVGIVARVGRRRKDHVIGPVRGAIAVFPAGKTDSRIPPD